MNRQFKRQAQRKRVARSWLWSCLVCAALPLPLKAEPDQGRSFHPIQLSHGSDESQIAVVMWTAFGSGCRSVEEQPVKERTVGFNILPKNAIHVPKLEFDLAFPQFSLNSGKRVEKDNTLELYSECALRFAIRGQPGRRLKKIDANVKMDIQKDKGSSLMLYNELRFGQFGGDEKRLEYEEGTELKKTSLDLKLSKDLPLLRSDGRSSCGTDQVLFYDFTMFAKKTNKASQVHVSLAPPKRARLHLEFENC
jgi:hypothetical protein